jgi:hypothetical protein
MQDNNSDVQVCTICGMRKVDGVFYWSTKDKEGNFKLATPEAVQAKVCSLARTAKEHDGELRNDMKMCINQYTGPVNPDLQWVELNTQVTKQTLDMFKSLE